MMFETFQGRGTGTKFFPGFGVRTLWKRTVCSLLVDGFTGTYNSSVSSTSSIKAVLYICDSS